METFVLILIRCTNLFAPYHTIDNIPIEVNYHAAKQYLMKTYFFLKRMQ